jgi:hypothetical protein
VEANLAITQNLLCQRLSLSQFPFSWSPDIRCDPEDLLRLLEWKHKSFFAQLRNATDYGGRSADDAPELP